eukprot:1179648-Prorocentrum_minimum.AAC.1
MPENFLLITPLSVPLPPLWCTGGGAGARARRDAPRPKAGELSAQVQVPGRGGEGHRLGAVGVLHARPEIPRHRRERLLRRPRGALPIPIPPITSTPMPITSTPMPITSTPMPITSTPLPITFTPMPITSNPMPISSTTMPISSTPMPITSTPMPITSTPMPMSSITMPITSTPMPITSNPMRIEMETKRKQNKITSFCGSSCFTGPPVPITARVLSRPRKNKT